MGFWFWDFELGFGELIDLWWGERERNVLEVLYNVKVYEQETRKVSMLPWLILISFLGLLPLSSRQSKG